MDYRCGTCETSDYLIEDHKEGIVVCTRCSIVLNRRFEPSRESFTDSERVSFLSNVDGVSSTAIEKCGSLQWAQQRSCVDAAERRRIKIDKLIEELVQRIGLNERTSLTAKGFYRQILKHHPKKTKKDELLSIVCIAIACRTAGFTRSFRELSFYCTNVTRKELGRAFKTYSRVLQGFHSSFTIVEMVPRVASLLGFDFPDERLCIAVVNRCIRFDAIPGQNPLSCLGGCLWFTIMLRPGKYEMSPSGVASVLSIAENTIRKAFRDLTNCSRSIVTKKIQTRYKIDVRSLCLALRKKLDAEFTNEVRHNPVR